MRPLPLEKMTNGLVEGFYATVASGNNGKWSRKPPLRDPFLFFLPLSGHVDLFYATVSSTQSHFYNNAYSNTPDAAVYKDRTNPK
jgi:hypothetical protein